MIESTSNAQIKRIQKLKKSAKYRRQEKVFLVEGYKMVCEAAVFDPELQIYISENIKEEYLMPIKEVAEENQIQIVSEKVFRELADTTTPQGVLAVVKMPEYEKSAIVDKKDAKLICLEDIQDPGNLGTIFRTAEGAGMDAVVLTKGCVDLFNPKVVRSTMGGLFRMPFWIVENLQNELICLKNVEFKVYTTYLEEAVDFRACSYSGKTAIVIGNEANGVRPETLACATQNVIIPMEGQLESLNAAVSAALLMYEVYRNREL